MCVTAVAQEWSFSVMFTHLSAQIVFKVINLLLMEKSIIIHGKNPGIVTSITLAVVNLIHPFVWEGIFVPLVPDNARELFGAPVPLIIGTTSAPSIQDVAPTTAVLYLDDDSVHEYVPPNSSSRSNSSSSSDRAIAFSAWFVRLPDVNADLTEDLEISKRVDHVQRLLCEHCRTRLEYCDEATQQLIQQLGAVAPSHPSDAPNALSPANSQTGTEAAAATTATTTAAKAGKSNGDKVVQKARGVLSIVNSVDSILMEDVPEPILRQLNVLIVSFPRYVRRFIGREVLHDPSNWKRFLRYSTRTGEEEFYPEYFIEPLRNQLEFQEAMVHTQLFVSFMDRLRREYHKQDHLR